MLRDRIKEVKTVNSENLALNVLILCEYSGRTRDAFIAKGHNAISCDLLPTDVAGPHYQGDCFDMLLWRWDLIIAHPPCTYLAVCANAHYGKGKPKHYQRIEAAQWTQKLWDKCIEVSGKVCFENPVSVIGSYTTLPKASYIQPWHHGHPEQKKTGLHLHGLDPIEPTNNVYDEMMLLPKNQRERIHYMAPSPDRWKKRSTTYQGISNAFAEQWGNPTKPLILSEVWRYANT
jgi:hypothetical protein